MNKNIIYPHALREGDTICLIDPSNAFTEKGIEVTRTALESMGFKVAVSPDIGFKRGKPTERAEILNGIFADPEYRGIFCIWGGYGTTTILEYLDFDAIAENRPAFLGFSDITAMHIAIQQRTGLVTYHGRANCREVEISQAVKNDLLARIQNPTKASEIVNMDGTPLDVIREGNCEGILTGGNLSLITRLMGTPFEIDTRGKILFIEEVGEKPYRVHGMLQQLLMGGKLREAEGILLGRFINCDNEGRPGSGFENIMDIMNQLDIPVIGNVQAGHIYETMTLPFGKVCRFENGKVIL